MRMQPIENILRPALRDMDAKIARERGGVNPVVAGDMRRGRTGLYSARGGLLMPSP